MLFHPFRAPRPARWLALISLAFAVAQFPAGVEGEEMAQPLLVTFASADGSQFRAVIERPEDIARVQTALEGDGYAGIPNGALAAGDGGFNAPHAWHMTGVEIVDVTIELCDGNASFVDEDLDYWLTNVGRFCPWSATVLAAEPFGTAPTPSPPAPTPSPTPPPVSPGPEDPPAVEPDTTSGSGTGTTTTLPTTGTGANGPGSVPISGLILGLLVAIAVLTAGSLRAKRTRAGFPV